MTVRFRGRMTRQTVAADIRGLMLVAGWTSEPVNFGAVPLRVLDGKQVASPEPNTAVVSLGTVGADGAVELGGGLVRFSVPLYVDVYGEDADTAESIADDLRDSLRSRHVPLMDHTAGPPVPVPGGWVEYEYAEWEEPDGSGSPDFRRHWRLLRATVQVTTSGGS